MKFEELLNKISMLEKQNENNEIIDKRQFNRNFLLSLNDLDFTQEEKRQCCLLAIGETNIETNFAIIWKQIYEYYMLSIGTEDNINIQENYGCFYNQKNHTLSTKSAEGFEEDNDSDIWISDYRVLEGVHWDQIAENNVFSITETGKKMSRDIQQRLLTEKV